MFLSAIFIALAAQPCLADATSVSFSFNASDLIRAPLSQGSSKNAGNQKIVAQNINSITSANSAGTWTSANSFNMYQRWANGLSSGEGLASFNIFLYSNYANASSWGQQLKLNPSNNPSVLSATAGAGWNYNVVAMDQNNAGLTPGPAAYGYSIQWYTTDENARINSASDLSGFSFTAPVELFDSNTNSTWAVEDGASYAVWFGTQNRPGDVLFTPPENFIQPIKFDNNWDGGVAGDTFASGDNSVWNGTMMLNATVIPEPSIGSLVLVSLGIGTLLRRRRTPSS
ncbi:MAG: PEP-CTERM sorting domain-containing protein [Verrucomicrobia bacterium]|nr:PEP-CTERM sorting domain-containing protein [Verrucomicrobiota bacterium]